MKKITAVLLVALSLISVQASARNVVEIRLNNGTRVFFDWNRYFYTPNHSNAYNQWCTKYRVFRKDTRVCRFTAANNLTQWAFDKSGAVDGIRWYRLSHPYTWGNYGNGFTVNHTGTFPSATERAQGVRVYINRATGRARLIIGYKSTNWYRVGRNDGPLTIIRKAKRENAELRVGKHFLRFHSMSWNGNRIE